MSEVAGGTGRSDAASCPQARHDGKSENSGEEERERQREVSLSSPSMGYLRVREGAEEEVEGKKGGKNFLI